MHAPVVRNIVIGLGVSVAVMAFAGHLLSEEAVHPSFQSPQAKLAYEKYRTRISKAEEVFQSARTAALVRYRENLEIALQAALKAQDLNEANLLKSEIDRVAADLAPEAPAPVADPKQPPDDKPACGPFHSENEILLALPAELISGTRGAPYTSEQKTKINDESPMLLGNCPINTRGVVHSAYMETGRLRIMLIPKLFEAHQDLFNAAFIMWIPQDEIGKVAPDPIAPGMEVHLLGSVNKIKKRLTPDGELEGEAKPISIVTNCERIKPK